MGLITSHATLITELKDEFNRTQDSSSPWTRFIQHAEEGLRRDPRVRRMVSTTLSVSAEEQTLPSEFKSIVTLQHDGPTVFDVVEIVPAEMLPGEKSIRGGKETGTPRKAAIVDDGMTLRFAPAPDATYTLDMTYWQTIAHLGGNVLSNWLLDDHSDIYLEASVLHGAKYFRDTEKAQEAAQVLERKLTELEAQVDEEHFGGPKVRRIHPIG